MSSGTSNLDALLQVKNEGGGNNKLYFYGEIVSDWFGAWDSTDQYPDSIRRFLDGRTGDLEIHINSPGGAVFAAMAITNELRQYKGGQKICSIDGWAASSASVIALSCDKVVMPANTYLMIHHAWGRCDGNAGQMRSFAEMLDKVDEGILSVYGGKLQEGKTVDDVREYMDAETYFTADEAAKCFKNIEVTEALKVAALANGLALERAPEKIRQAAAAAEERERLALLNLRRK